MRCFVVMGVAGCGKSSVGAEAATRCGMVFVDGDDLHPPANIEKMSNGIPLGDADREPWLQKVGQTLASQDGGVIIGCSALKRRYRDWIRDAAKEPVGFLHLAANMPVIADRMAKRKGHFMPESLLASQYADLEALEPDETGTVIDISQSFKAVVDAATTYLKESRS